jgi:hypothetical protein
VGLTGLTGPGCIFALRSVSDLHALVLWCIGLERHQQIGDSAREEIWLLKPFYPSLAFLLN